MYVMNVATQHKVKGRTELEGRCEENTVSEKKHRLKRTCQVSGQVWVVHETVAGKLYTLQPDWNVDVIEPGEKHQLYMRNLPELCITP